MTPAALQARHPRQAIILLGVTTLLTVLASYGYVALGTPGGRSQTTAGAVVLFVTALSCFAFGVLAGLLTRRMAPMLLGYLPGLVLVLLTGLQIADVPPHGAVAFVDVLRSSWVLVNPLLWLPFVALALALRAWPQSPEGPSRARTSGSTRRSTSSRTAP